MATALLNAGHRVFLTSTDIESLDETRRASGAGERAAVKTANLGNERELAELVDAAMHAFGRVDVLVSNAGIPNPAVRRPLDVTPDQLRRLFEINTLASINLIRLVVPGMVARRWGRIIFISTSLDTMLDPDHVAYGMTKAAGESFIAALATSFQSTGVTANVLLPGGAVATRMAAGVADPKDLLQPEIMAAPIAWLASDDSNNVTGRRFIAAKWNTALNHAQAAQAASAPAAWGGYGDKSIKP
ncbi:SDR family oxidoreductase [Mesorhizobium sp. WSM4904]|uniref:SDR family NAD(P)-dependent oxidoreductase n=1 Tax=Mesorhizobium sp. WSM4904 TaxID=3038545 RepID=UPI0024182354|nr:SDR family oxidoreductase [Mesorhizobium sp. WSM4904]WFP62644.1 SDR family NAD(P)-dependent oxidoreductase [Mesorhizobium sp. WSM4904]